MDDPHESPTYASPLPSTPAARVSAFPVSNWNRYEFVSFLGEGGMGRVFLARDTNLKRLVALKFIRGDDPELTRRFEQEARLQAQVEDDCICKVYEVGEVEGRHYIAMQYISGPSLKKLAPQLTVDQKVWIMQQVAEGIHAAHRLGLIHRDLKPNNILIEQTEEGKQHPYVLDFGLARSQHEEGMTVTGAAIGTPWYMSPEQAAGDVRNLDRRTDIYSLGVTMYEILSDRLPFEGQSVLEVMKKVADEEPVSIGKVRRGIPEDLQTIVMKCLEKEPGRRYDSARLLAEDLGRYLSGEPILAHRASIAYKLKRKARKNKPLVAVVILAFLSVAALSGLWIRARWNAVGQARIAQSFGQSVREVEAIMRYAHLSPIHDIRPDREKVRREMDRIQSMMKNLGEVGRGSGNYALGRGYLALGDHEMALKHLKLAWESGYQEPQVAYGLGLTLGKKYQHALEEAALESSPEMREFKIKQAEQDFRNPAVKYLEQARAVSGGSTEDSVYLQGLIAFYEGHYEDALKRAEGISSSWFYEAFLLQGDIRMAQARSQAESGDYDNAFRSFDHAAKAYAKAIEAGRSDDSAYLAEGARRVSLMYAHVEKGEDPELDMKQIEAVLTNASAVNPDNADIYRKLADAYGQMGWYHLYHTHEDPVPYFQKMIAESELALKQNPQDADSYNYIGIAWWRIAEYESGQGKDPLPNLKKAIETLQRATKINPKFAYAFNTMGNTYQNVARHELGTGKDPHASLKNAIDSYQKAIQVNARFSWPYNSSGNCYVLTAEYEFAHGQDPRKTLQQAVDSYQHSLHINPNYSYAYNGLGTAYQELGQYEMNQGRTPVSYFEKAIEAQRNVLRIDPTLPTVSGTIATVYADRAEYDFDGGKDPAPAIQQAKLAIEDDMKLDATYHVNYQTLCRLYILEARREARQGRSTDALFQKANAAIQKAIELNPQDSESLRWSAEITKWRKEIGR